MITSIDKIRGAGSPEKEPVGIKEKLVNLEQYLPGQEETVYEFARFLATRANDKWAPQGFQLQAELALHDLQKGKDGSTGKPIQNPLAGNSSEIYIILKTILPQIQEVIFGKEK